MFKLGLHKLTINHTINR